ncbi:YceD family protein [Chitinibacteraceae bacterium HSL-7]
MNVIHSADFARERLSSQGEVEPGSLARLADVVLAGSGALKWSLAGSVDVLERPCLKLEVSGALQLGCQRCLQPMPFELRVSTVLVQFDDEQKLDDAEEEDEDLEGMLVDPELDVLALIEDEVLLALPYAPRHAQCGGVAGVAAKSDKPNPFAVLATLKTRKAED